MSTHLVNPIDSPAASPETKAGLPLAEVSVVAEKLPEVSVVAEKLPEVSVVAEKQLATPIDILAVLKNFQQDMQKTKDENIRLWDQVKKLLDEKNLLEIERDEFRDKNTELIKKAEFLEHSKQLVLTNTDVYYKARSVHFEPIFNAIPLIPLDVLYQKITLIRCTSTDRYFFMFECEESQHSNRYIVPIKKETYDAFSCVGFFARNIEDMKYIATPDFYEIRFCRILSDTSQYFRFGIYGKKHETFYGYSGPISWVCYPFPLDKPYLEGL